MKRVEDALELARRQLEAQLVEARAQPWRPESLPSTIRAVRATPMLARVHDLVGLAHLQHAVLVDARVVAERVRADDRLVRLHGDAGQALDQAAGAVELARVDAVSQPERSLAACAMAITTSSSEALPARSPMPLIVHLDLARAR